MKKIIIALLSLFAVLNASADMAVSVTGTPNATKMGYEWGQSYTFTWVVNEGYTGSGIDRFNASENYWYIESETHPMLWSSISGDGLTGSYTRPVGFSAPFDYLNAYGAGLILLASNDDPGSTSQGLTVNSQELRYIYTDPLSIGAIDYSDASFVNPASWLSDYAGTYAQSGKQFYLADEIGNTINFSATSMTVEAVPEPATALSLLIGGGLLTLIRRFYGRA